jgi:hypothetical protein
MVTEVPTAPLVGARVIDWADTGENFTEARSTRRKRITIALELIFCIVV